MCDEYKKILNPFMRDHDNGGRLVYGAWTLPMFEYLAYGTWILTEKVGHKSQIFCICEIFSQITLTSKKNSAINIAKCE